MRRGGEGGGEVWRVFLKVNGEVGGGCKASRKFSE